MRLRRERKAAGLTQAELAKRAKVPQGTISGLETGRYLRPTFETLNRLAVVLQKCGRRVTEMQLQPRRQPLLIKGARSERQRRSAAALAIRTPYRAGSVTPRRDSVGHVQRKRFRNS